MRPIAERSVRTTTTIHADGVTLLLEVAQPVARIPGPRPGGAAIAVLLDGPIAGWREDLRDAGLSRLPIAIVAGRQQAASFDRLGTYVLERLEGGTGFYRWAERPAGAPGVRST